VANLQRRGQIGLPASDRHREPKKAEQSKRNRKKRTRERTRAEIYKSKTLFATVPKAREFV